MIPPRAGRRCGRPAPVLAALAVGVLALPGCVLGPAAIRRTHAHYNDALRRTADEQLLLNIVRLRYNDTINRLDVASIAAQFELSAGAGMNPLFGVGAAGQPPVLRPFTSILPTANGLAADRPTITMTPAETPDMVKRLLRPLPLEGIIYLAETSWPIDHVMRLWIEYANGVPNASALSGPTPRVAPEFARFQRVAALMQRLHELDAATIVQADEFHELSGPLPDSEYIAVAAADAAKSGLEFQRRELDGRWVVGRRDKDLRVKINPRALAAPELLELCSLLDIEPGRTEYKLQVGSSEPYAQDTPLDQDDTIALVPRSPLQVLYYVSHGVVVPPEDLASGVAPATCTPDGRPFPYGAVLANLFRVCHADGMRPPAHAAVAVRYRDHWFYIDERDQPTKATFALLAELMRLDLGGNAPIQSVPLLTLPLGR
jgi:hypothetical protein